jgi:hypothetical protein
MSDAEREELLARAARAEAECVRLEAECVRFEDEIETLQEKVDDLEFEKSEGDGVRDAAIRILEQDAGITERDLEFVAGSVDPVGTIRRDREARKIMEASHDERP